MGLCPLPPVSSGTEPMAALCLLPQCLWAHAFICPVVLGWRHYFLWGMRPSGSSNLSTLPSVQFSEPQWERFEEYILFKTELHSLSLPYIIQMCVSGLVLLHPRRKLLWWWMNETWIQQSIVGMISLLYNLWLLAAWVASGVSSISWISTKIQSYSGWLLWHLCLYWMSVSSRQVAVRDHSFCRYGAGYFSALVASTVKLPEPWNLDSRGWRP